MHPEKKRHLELGYSDIASEIMFLREKNNKKFNLTNELSKKNLHEQQ